MNIGKISRAGYKRVTHVIFDLDGTLINSDEVVLKLYQKITSRYGKCLTLPQKSKILKMQSMETIDFIIKDHSLPLTVEEFYRNVIKELKKLTGDSCKLKPGVEKLVQHLYKNKIPLAIATNSPKELCDISTGHCLLLKNCFHHTVCAPSEPQVKKDKPAPDVFLECARRFQENPSPEKVLVIEDSLNGVEAAVAAGMQVVAVPNPLVDVKFFQNATIVLETLEHFEPELFGLPPFQKKPIIMACCEPVTHVIFDLDGTLIDMPREIAKIFQTIAEMHGKFITVSQLVHCLGLQGSDMMAFIIKELDLPISVEEFYKEVVNKLKSNKIKIKPGVERLVKHFHNNKVPIAIATNSPKERFDIATRDHQELISYFHHLVTGPSEPEVEGDKPLPDVFLLCARRFKDKPSPEKVSVIGSSLDGVRATAASGMQIVEVPKPLVEVNYFKNAAPSLKTLKSFMLGLFGLTSFPDGYIMMSCYKPVTHVIFDFDGTIIEIEETVTKIFQAVVHKYGKHLTSSQLKHCIGWHLPERYDFVIKELGLPINAKEFNDDVVKMVKGAEVKIKPGVERLVKHLHDNKVPIAIATNSPKERFDITTRDHQELISYFHHLVTGPSEPEVKRDKPFPDVFLVCARRFNDSPSPEKVLVIEDSPCGVEAAVEAGMQVVMVPHPLLDPKLRENATLVLDTLEKFQPELFGLPPFQNKETN